MGILSRLFKQKSTAESIEEKNRRFHILMDEWSACYQNKPSPPSEGFESVEEAASYQSKRYWWREKRSFLKEEILACLEGIPNVWVTHNDYRACKSVIYSSDGGWSGSSGRYVTRLEIEKKDEKGEWQSALAL